MGTGDSGGGVYVNPQTESLLHPGQYARRLFFLNAGCAHHAPHSVDRAYIERMLNLVDGLRPGCKLILFAFERVHDERGLPQPDATTFHVPDAYARDVARRHPQAFEWAASIHPYDPRCAERVAQAKREGARAVKWLPAAMNIDPASAQCDAFYAAMEKAGLPLISHAGEERAVLGAGRHDFGNPLRLRRALEAGVRVVIAHCASIGEDRDLDAGPRGPYVESFSLFARMFSRYEKNLFGDISAVTQVNRAGPALARILEEQSWHARLLNGSDYPLPGVMPIFSVEYLASLRLIEAAAVEPLREIRLHNPLLFDFVVKRHLRSNGKALAPGVFETKGFFSAAL